MQQQLLLSIEIVSKLAPGVLLFLMPRLVIKAAGLPSGQDSFWSRLAGAGLIALAVGTYIEAQVAPGKGLGILGSAAINLTLAALLGSLLIVGRVPMTKRGRALLWLTAAALTLLALVEIVSTR